MTKTRRYAEIKLNEEVLPASWSEFVSRYGFKWSKRSTSDFNQWKALRGKGYQIWISIPYPKRIDNSTYWEYAIDTTNHLPEEAITFLEEILTQLKTNFPKTEVKTKELTEPKPRKKGV